MDSENRLGQWIKRRRRQLDLTQQQLADCAACSVITIRKFENGERRPSRELALLLAQCLNVPPEDQARFVDFARGVQPDIALSASADQRKAVPRSHSLPVPSSPFVGRFEELAQIAALLSNPNCHLITLVGVGGMGKTRLALAAAEQHKSNFPDGIAFVSLASLHDPAQVPEAVVRSLNIALSGHEQPAEQVRRYLGDKSLLVVLDNFEHLLDAADQVAEWMQNSPRTRWLVTSRERLNLVEEWIIPVGGFAEVDSGSALFVQTAQRVQPAFSPAGHEAVIARICQYVGGMPLAIELAAGWTAVLSPEQILTHMQTTFDFLSTDLRNVPQRHRSLRSLFDNTWQLLSPAEQDTLMNLSTFSGGFDLDAATAVAGTSASLMRTLANKSLFFTNASGRLFLHDLTRQYAAEKLHESGQQADAFDRHLRYFLSLAQTADPQLYGSDAAAWYSRLADENDNFRTALSHAQQQWRAEALVQLVDALWWFWFRRGYWREAEHWLTAALNLTPEDSPERCLLLHHSSVTAAQGRYDEAMPYLMQALTAARRLQAYEPLMQALLVVGQASPDTTQALQAFAEAEAILSTHAIPRQEWLTAYLHYLAGDRLRESGQYADAERRYRQSLALLREMGNVDNIAYPLGNLGRLAIRRGELDEAASLIGESVAVSRAIGNRTGVGDWLLRLGMIRLYQGDIESAESSLKETLRIVEESGSQRGRAETLACLALVLHVKGNQAHAHTHIQASLALYHEAWERSLAGNIALTGAADYVVPDFVDALLVAGLVSAAQGQHKRAATLLTVGERLASQSGHQPDPPLLERARWVGACVSGAFRERVPNRLRPRRRLDTQGNFRLRCRLNRVQATHQFGVAGQPPLLYLSASALSSFSSVFRSSLVTSVRRA